jgi:hypothetical protein
MFAFMASQTHIQRLNRLEHEQSAYLRSAAHQPVNWYPWGAEAFEKAKKANKPVLLDIGAVWCHWCHVMDMESYENEAIASIINNNFVAIKVDRDERPDIDVRYQAAVSAISGQGGWPLTAFLTPEGKVFYGGTYFPPEDRYGRTGFPRVLEILAQTFRNEPHKINQNAAQIDEAVRAHLARPSEPTDLNESLLDSAINSISRGYDPLNGGFGTAPKFPHTGAIELLLARHAYHPESWMMDIVVNTLRKMARGGIYDQLGGGFHRYSTDEKWIVPHFEKMLYDNASLLSNYVHAYQATGDSYFKTLALDIIRYVNDVLSDQANGGFYASQDADVKFGDDGSYFTWTKDEAAALLAPEEFQVAQLHYNIYEQGEMHHDRTQNVLFVDKDSDVIAAILRKPEKEIDNLLRSARSKMLSARNKKKAPFVDTTLYSSWNGMMIVSYLEASKAFGEEGLRDFAIKSLDRILSESLTDEGFITHRPSRIARDGFLDDQVEIANALLSAFEVAGKTKYLNVACKVIDHTVALFWDPNDAGFFDTPQGHGSIGALNIPIKPIQDSPTPGGNSVAIRVLNKLALTTGELRYRELAEKALKFFAPTVQNYGLFAATFFLGLHEFLNPPPHIVIVAEDNEPLGMELFKTAHREFRPGMTIAKVAPKDIQSLPPFVRAMAESSDGPTAYICTGFSCAPPVHDSKSLVAALREFLQPSNAHD